MNRLCRITTTKFVQSICEKLTTKKFSLWRIINISAPWTKTENRNDMSFEEEYVFYLYVESVYVYEKGFMQHQPSSMLLKKKTFFLPTFTLLLLKTHWVMLLNELYSHFIISRNFLRRTIFSSSSARSSFSFSFFFHSHNVYREVPYLLVTSSPPFTLHERVYYNRKVLSPKVKYKTLKNEKIWMYFSCSHVWKRLCNYFRVCGNTKRKKETFPIGLERV